MNIRQMDKTEIQRIREIDRTEDITLGYVIDNGHLKAESGEWHVSRWPDDDVTDRINEWSSWLEPDGVLIGAFEDDMLVGFIIFRPHLMEDMAQLAVLHVSKDHRRKGIARTLTQEVIQLAKDSGAKRLYVSATPSQSAVGFYRSQGFELTNDPHPDLYALEPEDIHMIKSL